MAAQRGLTVDGLVEIRQGLDRLGAPDDVFAKAANTAGQVIAKQAYSYAPKNTGAMARTIAVDTSKGGFVVTAGDATVKYAYTFHAVALGRSKGGFTFTYPARGGRRAYTRKARIPNKPFLFQAAQVKAKEALKAYEAAMDELLKRAAP
jgi:hypothetical protein